MNTNDQRIRTDIVDLLSSFNITNEMLATELLMLVKTETSKSLSEFMRDAAQLMASGSSASHPIRQGMEDGSWTTGH